MEQLVRVKETYDNGTAIVINYNDSAYNRGGLKVNSMDYLVTGN